MSIEPLVIAVFVACVAVAAGIALRAYEAAIWLSLVILGQAAALQLIDAGPTVHYQHLRSLERLFAGGFALPLLLIGAQTGALIVRGLQRKARFASIWESMRARLGAWRWMALVVVVFLLGAVPSRELSAYGEELIFALALQIVNFGTIAMFVMAMPDRLLETVRNRLERSRASGSGALGRLGLDGFWIGCAAWVTAAAILLSVFAYQRQPHVPDELSYLYQAKYFADGELTMPAPPVPEAFSLDLMSYDDGRWYSPLPPGWPAVLSVGVWLGIPWLVNPFLAGLNVLLSAILVDRLYGRPTSRVAALLLAASPWNLFMAMSLMAHTLAFTCLLVAALAVERIRAGGSYLWGVPGGVALGMISLIRPLEGLAVAVAMGVWALVGRSRTLRLGPVAVLTVVTIAVGSLQLAYNAAITGEAARFPVMAYFDETYGVGSNALGFGPDRGLDWPLDPYPGHGLRDVVVNSMLNMTSIDIELFGWSVASLLPLGLLVLSGGMRRTDYQLLTLIVWIPLVNSLYWFSGGPDFGARYWFPVLLPAIILSARGIEWVTARARDSMSGVRIALAVAALVLVSLATFVPWRAVDKYHDYRGMRPYPRQIAESDSFRSAVVLVRGNREPDYAAAAAYNPVNLDSDAPVFVWDRDPGVRHQILEAFPNRSVWLLDGPSLTGGEFEIVAGPLRTGEALFLP